MEKVLEQARRQVDAIESSTFTKIEWRVADPKVAKALQTFFGKIPDLARKITVIYVP